MQLGRLVRATALVLGAILTGASAVAQAYPDKPIRIVVPYPPGGSADSIARQLGIQLTQSLKQQVIVDNRPGGNSVIAAQNVLASPADGYTLLISDPTALSINPSLFHKLSYQPKDFAPIGTVASFPFVLLVNASSPYRTVKEFIAAARANPGKMNYSSPGLGTPVQLAAETFKDATKTDIVHVPYKGAAAALSDLLGGQLESMFTDMASAVPFIQSGKVRALAVTSPKRFPNLPEVPTLAESGYPGVQLSAWYGISAPKNTPPQVIATLNTAIRDAVANPAFRQWIASQNFEPKTTTPAEFAEIIQQDAAQWGATVNRLGIKID